MSEEVKEFKGSARVERDGSFAAVSVCLRKGTGSAIIRSIANLADDRKNNDRKALALSGLGYASTQFRQQYYPCEFFITEISGDAEERAFSIARCSATWLALNEEPPSDFDNIGWQHIT